VILAAVADAQTAGSRLKAACSMLGISARTIERWRGDKGSSEDRRCGPRQRPPHALTPAEETEAIALLTCPEYRGVSPKQLVPRLADQGTYVASESTLYRLRRRLGLHEGRRPVLRNHVTRANVVHRATGPNQVWSWDITYLPTTLRGRFAYLYLVMDVWSRRIVGWQIHEQESAHCAAALIREICTVLQIDPNGLVLHSDNGKPMRGSTMVATLQWLGIVPSFSRPHVSDDNPYSEALFRTLKHTPAYPRLPFADVHAARRWVSRFVDWYNTEHRHSAIRYVTPDERHNGLEGAILAGRHRVYQRARQRRPHRWSRGTRNWSPIGVVLLNPDPINQNVPA
jgi:putative transposase